MRKPRIIAFFHILHSAKIFDGKVKKQMTVLCVDDEVLLLKVLKRAVLQSPDVTEAICFDDEIDALSWAATHDFDAAFLDIQLHEMDGIELARELLRLHPDSGIVFCTGHRSYAIDVLGLHWDSGYLVKPIDAESVQREIDHIKAVRQNKDCLITVCCYGGFEAYDRNGNPLRFKRKRAKELLALLIDRNGISMTAKEVCAVMFADDGVMEQKNMDYFYKLYYELMRVLTESGAQAVIQKNGVSYYADMSCVNFDNTNKNTKSYLEEYSWV